MQHNGHEIVPTVKNTDAWRAELKRLGAKTTPTFVHLGAQLPVQGRTNQVLAATPNLSVVLKTYASGGENALHAHPNEDHLFLILQGAATFHGPEGEMRRVAKNDVVVLPQNSLYWFIAEDVGEALVLLRIGAALDPAQDVLARTDAAGAPFDGKDEANKGVPLILGEQWFE